MPIIVLALATGGCGGGGATTSGDTDPQQVTDVLTDYYAAEASGDLRRACGYLTGAKRTELVQLINMLGPRTDPQVTACPDALESVLKVPGVRALVTDVRIGDVSVSGDTARAVARATTSDGVNAVTHYSLTRTNGGWKIDPGAATNANARVAPP